MTTMTAFTSTDTDFSTKVKVQATSRGKSGFLVLQYPNFKLFGFIYFSSNLKV